jgi:hypothetical protein
VEVIARLMNARSKPRVASGLFREAESRGVVNFVIAEAKPMPYKSPIARRSGYFRRKCLEPGVHCGELLDEMLQSLD